MTSFATKEDLKNSIYNYQTDQITQSDDSIVQQALLCAEQEVRSYLEFNHKKEYLDGRLHYNTQLIFSARGANRNPLILGLVLTLAKWYIVEIANVDILYEKAKERYDQAVQYLKQLSKGEVTLAGLPTIEPKNSADKTAGFRFGSNPKFNHHL